MKTKGNILAAASESKHQQFAVLSAAYPEVIFSMAKSNAQKERGGAGWRELLPFVALKDSRTTTMCTTHLEVPVVAYAAHAHPD